MDRQPYLANDLVRLRPMQTKDRKLLFEVAKDPGIWEQHPVSDRHLLHKFDSFFQDSLDSKGALIVEELPTGQIIGSSRFQPVEGIDWAIEIGWSFLAKSHWGGTYNQAVKGLMVDHAFKSMEVIVFYIDKQNIRSQKAVEKLGAYRSREKKTEILMRNPKKEWTYVLTR